MLLVSTNKNQKFGDGLFLISQGLQFPKLLQLLKACLILKKLSSRLPLGLQSKITKLTIELRGLLYLLSGPLLFDIPQKFPVELF